MKCTALVHCHLCVLKDVCSFSASEESYRYQHFDGCGSYPLSREEDQKLIKASMNCPIKKVVLKL